MKIFHLSDLHIGLRLMNRDFGEDQKYILNKVIEAASEQKPDAVVIAGDIYDKAIPSAEAVEIFDDFINHMTDAVPEASIMIVSGNHDSAPRLNSFRKLLAKRNVHMIGNPPVNEDDHIEKIVLEDEHGRVNFYLLPFVKPSMIKLITGTEDNGNLLTYNEAVHRLIDRENVDTSERNVIVSHQFYVPSGTSQEDMENMDRSDSEIKTVGNIDHITSDALDAFDYAALGHIHRPMSVGRDTVRYCGTPLACSVSEAGQHKGIIVIEMGEKGTLLTDIIPLEPLRQIRIIKGELKEILAQSCDDYVTAIITDEDYVDSDANDRLRAAFPYLLEIRRERRTGNARSFECGEYRELDEMEMCRAFLGELDEQDIDLLQDIINSVKGEVSR